MFNDQSFEPEGFTSHVSTEKSVPNNLMLE